MATTLPALEVDPCGRATALRALLDTLASGSGVLEYDVEHGNGVRRRVRYSASNTAYLKTELEKAEAKCASLGGLSASRPMRFAIGRKAWS